MHWSALLRDVEYTRGGVPKILHQIWINERPDPPAEWAAARAKWKAHHPEWKHMIWCKHHARAYIAQWHPTFVDVFDGYPHEIQRIDMIRYFFLYDFGGVYCDLDQYPERSVERYLETGAQAYFVHSANWASFTNSLMASQRRAPVWLEVQARLRAPRPWWCVGKHLTVMMTTGPGMLDGVLRNTAEQFAVLPRRKFNPHPERETGRPGAIIVSLLGRSWNELDSVLINFAATHRWALAAAALAFVVCTTAAAVVFAVRWHRLRHTACARAVAHCARGGASLVGL
jgi:mannosyltransferase OCH1-like enzyme